MSGRKKLVVLVAVAVVMVLIGVVLDATSKKITGGGHTRADEEVAVQIADYLTKNGYTDHVTSVKVVGDFIYIYTNFDGSTLVVLAHSRAVDICNAARTVAPNNSDIFVETAAKLPIFRC